MPNVTDGKLMSSDDFSWNWPVIDTDDLEDRFIDALEASGVCDLKGKGSELWALILMQKFKYGRIHNVNTIPDRVDYNIRVVRQENPALWTERMMQIVDALVRMNTNGLAAKLATPEAKRDFINTVWEKVCP